MDILIGELMNVREKLILEVPEMLLGFNSCANSIKGILGCLLVFCSDGPIVNKGLESLHWNVSSAAWSLHWYGSSAACHLSQGL